MIRFSKVKFEQGMRIGVYGSWRPPIPMRTLQWASGLGQAIAENGHVLLTGGSGGTLLASRKGSRQGQGINVGIIPELASPPKLKRRSLIDIVIPTGFGALGRMPILANAVDIAFALGGGAGTLAEIALTYLQQKPVFLIDGLQKKGSPSISRILVRRRHIKAGQYKIECGWLDGKEEDLVAPIFIFPVEIGPRSALRLAIALSGQMCRPLSKTKLGPLDE